MGTKANKAVAKRVATSAKREKATSSKSKVAKENNTYRFGGTQSFPLRQLWPYKAYQFSLRRMKKGQEVSYADTKQAIMELCWR